MRYPILFLDCDGTLFDFDQSERNAMKALSVKAGFSFEETIGLYHRINQECWEALERGELTQPVLRVERFKRFFTRIGCPMDPVQGSKIYGEALGHEGIPYPYTKDLLTRLRKQGYKLYVTTNGLAETQRGRYAACGFMPYIDDVFISEEIGYAKPDRRYFEAVLKRLGNPPKRDCVVIGDSLTSDIQGGVNAGLDTIWYNPKGKPLPSSPRPTYTISDLTKIGSLL